MVEGGVMYSCDIGGIMGWGGGITNIIFAVLFITLAIIIINRLLPQHKKNSDATDSIEILKRRLAAGEISLEEYEKLKKFI